ncbi:MAG TPA: L,D-transpeptidase family protein [Phycisphaerae bacterium]|nr:L,D-transpeptidase family protein [Phycisphaerae bacterium]HNU46406.1 L,D-transpeptidase family protein [Phycisphaerae bacterium]
MARYRRRHNNRWGLALVLFAAVAGGGAWYFNPWQDAAQPSSFVDPQRPLTTDRPELLTSTNIPPDVPEHGSPAATDTPARTTVEATPRADALLATGRQALARGEWVTARTQLNEALRLGVPAAELSQVQADLVRIANETIFSPRICDNDLLVERYVVQPGDSLGKIASQHQLGPEFIASINGISNVNLIRAGQTLKLVRGPFRAVVDKAAHTLDVYLGDYLVRHFRVGLGAEGSTPTGEWRVSVKLVNPTYYPPRGGKIVAADDPQNPLGERWIGLEGVSGEALGQERYGVHGTIDPDSIGRNASHGCIRMFNEDVEFLYDLLVVKHSTVTVK